jgi:methylmalonyl-CoA mutase N-terminal domain/subunit
VGVNRFVSPYPPIKNILRVDPVVEERQKQRLAEIKRTRDNAKVQDALSRLEEVARGSENTMPFILDCVEAYATVGEICDVFRKVFGMQREFLVF